MTVSPARLDERSAPRAGDEGAGQRLPDAVLLLGDEPRVITSIARPLAKRGVEVHVAHAAGAPAVRSRSIRGERWLPDLPSSDSRLVDAVLEVAKAAACTVLIPCNDTALGFVAANERRLRHALRVEAPSADVIRRVLDKDETLRIAVACGIAIPRSYSLRDREELARLAPTLRFPVVVKPARKAKEAAFKVRYYPTAAALDAELASDPSFGVNNLVQEFCPGDGVGIGVLLRDGQPVAMIQHRRLKEFPWTGGVSVTAISEAVDAALAEPSLRLLRAMEWDGVAMVEWKHDRTSGSAILMEVNGRFWGSHALAVAAGLDLPGLLVARTPAPPSPFLARPGVVSYWLAGDLQRVVDVWRGRESGLSRPSVLAAASSVALDLVRGRRHALWQPTDPRPAVDELLRVSRRLAVGEVKAVARAVVPQPLVSHFRRWRKLGQPARRAYLRRLAARTLGGARPDATVRELRSIVFVCHGNIMRSAFAEALLRRELGSGADVHVSSAGMHAKVGRPADPRAVAAADALGVSLVDHRSQPMSAELVRAADLVVAMDYANEAELLASYPDARGKVVLVGELARRPGESPFEIADPYSGTDDDVQSCFRRVAEHVRWLGERLGRPGADLPSVPR